jgi:4-cresol dehydrogenase (hydroxylating) flavoprotein subunit
LRRKYAEGSDRLCSEIHISLLGGFSVEVAGQELERGYGITPLTDHFQGITWIEAVLSRQGIYWTPLTEMGAERADKAFKWGDGPYLDGHRPTPI